MQASFIGAIAIADLVKTTLGPKGMVCDLVVNFNLYRRPSRYYHSVKALCNTCEGLRGMGVTDWVTMFLLVILTWTTNWGSHAMNSGNT